MSISDINRNHLKKTIYTYLIFSIFCFIFSFIYLKFSYGVVSLYMKYLAIIPLILGVLIYFILYKLKVNLKKISYNFYNAGVVTLTVGSAVKGIFAIAGAYSNYIKFYLIIGIIFIIFALINNIIKKKHD